MGRVRFLLAVCLATFHPAVFAAAPASSPVALRVEGGRFLATGADGAVRPGRLFVAEAETFNLLPRDEGAIALRAPNGRWLTAGGQARGQERGQEGRKLYATSTQSEPGRRETFRVVRVEENRCGLQMEGTKRWIHFSGPDPKARGAASADTPLPAETVEIFHVAAVPESIRSCLASLVQTLASEELADRPYDRVRTRKREQYWDLPAPQRGDLLRTTKRRVLSVTEEYHLQAQLDGPMSLEVVRLSVLKGYSEPGARRILFVLRARLPIRGHVSYRVPDLLSASTGFRTKVRLEVVGELKVRKAADQLALNTPEVLDMEVELNGLDLSNDVLQTFRGPIEDLANDELSDNKQRIRQRANKALGKAFAARQLQHPLLRLLSFP